MPEGIGYDIDSPPSLLGEEGEEGGEGPKSDTIDMALGAAYDAMQEGNREAFTRGIRAAFKIFQANSDME